jgi:hypothetical protein
VFQPAVGFAGAGTLLLRTSDDVAALVAASPAGSRVGKLVEYVAGEPVTINGVVIPAGVHGVDEHSEDGEVLVGMPCRQLTGVAELTPTEFGSCGNDWSLPPSRDAVIALRSLARRVGAELGRRGFFGAFGIDAVLQQGTQVPVLIEINPRWTASLALQVELQAAHSLPTFLDAHLAACAYRAEERTSLAELRAAYGDENDAGCTRTADTVSTIIAFHTGDDPVRVGPHMQPGVWRTKPSLERVRDGWRVEHLRSADEVLITPASHARDVEHGSFLVRVTMRGTAAASPEANELRPDVMRVMRDVLKVLRRGADGVS